MAAKETIKYKHMYDYEKMQKEFLQKELEEKKIKKLQNFVQMNEKKQLNMINRELRNKEANVGIETRKDRLDQRKMEMADKVAHLEKMEM